MEAYRRSSHVYVRSPVNAQSTCPEPSQPAMVSALLLAVIRCSACVCVYMVSQLYLQRYMDSSPDVRMYMLDVAPQLVAESTPLAREQVGADAYSETPT